MRRLVAVLAFALVASGSDTGAPAPDGDLGTWHVSRLVFHNEFAMTQGLTRAQARAELGAAVVVTKAGIQKLGRQACAEGRVVDTLDRAELLRSNKLVPAPGKSIDLGLPDRVTVFNYGCVEFWLRTDGHMIAGVDGYYFELVKSHPSSAAASSFH